MTKLNLLAITLIAMCNVVKIGSIVVLCTMHVQSKANLHKQITLHTVVARSSATPSNL